MRGGGAGAPAASAAPRRQRSWPWPAGSASILDGNVKRVLSRYFGVAGTPGERSTEQTLWRCAEQCTPQTQVAVYTQAVMDFGATLCTRRRPLCMHCPLNEDCAAYRTGRVDELPAARVRAARRARGVVMLLVVRADGCVLLQRRPPQGIWGGLWTPPEFGSVQAAAHFCTTQLAAGQLCSEPLLLLRHAFTHFVPRADAAVARCVGAAAAAGWKVMVHSGITRASLRASACLRRSQHCCPRFAVD